MAFFIGTPDGQNGHDELGHKIGEAGRLWARDHVCRVSVNRRWS
jgi:hypothetical protein